MQNCPALKVEVEAAVMLGADSSLMLWGLTLI